jgi:hypothetical protein
MPLVVMVIVLNREGSPLRERVICAWLRFPGCMVIVGTGGTKRMEKELGDVTCILFSNAIVSNTASTVGPSYVSLLLHSTYRVYEVDVPEDMCMPYPLILPVAH